jgi:hypothetical protein
MALDWKDLVKTVAPWLGTALGGPLGGAAVTAIAGALGLSDNTESAIKAALSGATPEQLLAVKQADNDFALKMQQIGYDHVDKIAEFDFKNVDSARSREVQVRDNTNRNLAYFYTIGYFSLLVFVLFFGIKLEVREIMTVLLSILTAAQAAIMNYYFGSSHGSDRKTEIMAGSAPTTP